MGLESRSAYQVAGPREGELLEVPAWATAWPAYQATTGHLVNHGSAPRPAASLHPADRTGDINLNTHFKGGQYGGDVTDSLPV